MGAGVYYTNNIDQTRAVWLDMQCDCDCDCDCDCREFFEEDIFYSLESILERENKTIWQVYRNSRGLIMIESESYNIVLESGNHGELVFNMYEQSNLGEFPHYELALYNAERSYHKLIKLLVKNGFRFRIATSGYTSTEYNP